MTDNNSILHYMLVPLSQEALEIDMKQKGNPSTGNFKEWALTEAEASSIINSLLFSYCEEFDIYIDISEDRILDKAYVPKALEMAKEFEQHCKKEVQKSAVKKVIESLEFAKTTDMPVWFWF